MDFIISLVGYFLIFMAIDINRPIEYDIKMWSKDYFLMLFLVFVGTLLIKHF